jgi:hypothetical protein
MITMAILQTPASTPAASEGAAAIGAAVAAGLSAVVAIIALVIAWKAFTATRATPFNQLVVNELFSILRRAREVRSRYTQLFQPFENMDAKTAAWGAWTKAREEVGTSLDEMVALVPELKNARVAWTKVEQEEDTHVTSNSTSVSADAGKAAIRSYDDSHSAFVTILTTGMQSMK